MTGNESRKSGFLNWIEQVGNKMPHPFALFLYITAIVLVLSCVLGLMGVSAVHPTSGETITVVNLISMKGLLMLMKNFVSNFQGFSVLGIVLVLGVATGICDRHGFFSTAIKMGLASVKGNAVVFIIAFIGVLANQAGDAAFILVPSLAGAIFFGMGRHPLAGVFLGYAAVGGGFTTSLIPSGWDVTLTPITVAAAQTMDPDFELTLIASYFILFAAAILVTIAAGLVTIKVIEPMLGTYEGDATADSMEVTVEERRACKKAGMAVLIFLLVLVAVCIPKNSFMRNPENGSLVFGSNLMSCLQFIIIVVFSLAGITYSIAVGKTKRIEDLVAVMEDSIRSLSGFIVLAIVIGQFLFLFNQSQLGQVLAIRGGQALASLPVPTQVLVVLFLALTALVNLFIGSGTTKWLLLGPIFVPMLMQLNIHPAFIQAIYRLGDCSTNHLTPLFAYFAILLTTAKKYDKNVGMGTLFKNMIPYSATFFVVYAILLVLWMTLNLPTGIGGGVWLS